MGFKKGNKAAARPFEKEMAQHYNWQSIYQTAEMLFSMPQEELNVFMKSDEMKKLPYGVYMALLAFKNKNYKYAQWFQEMILGKPKQQTETTHKTDGSIKLLVDAQDLGL